MAKYTNRTCVNCGIRRPQPEMYQKEIQVVTGKSKKTASGATVFGAFMGDEKSSKSIRDAIYNTNQRTYTRKRKVWVCPDCYGDVKSEKDTETSSLTFWVVAIIIVALFSSMNDSKKDSKSDVATSSSVEYNSVQEKTNN